MQLKCPELQSVITYEVFFKIYSKVNFIIYSSLSIYSSIFKALASIVFEIFHCQDFIHIFQRAKTQVRGKILSRKKQEGGGGGWGVAGGGGV